MPIIKSMGIIILHNSTKTPRLVELSRSLLMFTLIIFTILLSKQLT